MKLFLIDEGQLQALRKTATELYKEERINGDAMRDMGHCLSGIVRVCEQLEVPEYARPKPSGPVNTERLQRACNLANNTHGDVVAMYTAEEWLRIYDAYKASGWDLTPDRWTVWQREGALRGVVPAWGAGEGDPLGMPT